MSFIDVVWSEFANANSSEHLKNQFDKYCDWCWEYGCGNCDSCKKDYHKLYIPLRISEKQKELGLPITRRVKL